MENIFKNIIGQDKPKKELGFYLDSYRKTRIMPNLMFVAPKGQGKTTLARAAAKGLVQFDDEGTIIEVPSKLDPTVMRQKRKPFVEINCSTIKGIKQFVNGILIPFVVDKDVTLLFDEASELPHDVSMALLTILNPNPTNKTTFALEEYVCDFDFSRQSFFFATSEIHRVFHALADRLERITLEDYTLPQLGAIVQNGAPDVEFKEDVLLEIAPVLRGNARAAQKMSDKIRAYLSGNKVFGQDDWKKLSEVLSIYPLGLNALEIQILRYLEASPTGTSLTALSARTGMSRDALQKDVEIYLQRHQLLEIQTTGRIITHKGREYLKHLNQSLPTL